MSIPTLSNLEAESLITIVHAALDSSTAEIEAWQISPITQGRASAAGVYRVAGTAQERNERIGWSLIVKVVGSGATSVHAGNNASEDPTSMMYWKREELLYRSGFFDHLPPGLAAPRCYRIDELPHEARIWMEDVQEEVGTTWPLDHYRHVARHFGRLNGLYLAERPLPTWPWLLSDHLPMRAQGSEWPEFWQSYPTLRLNNALVQRGWSDELVQEFQRIWQDRERFVLALARLPKTLNHNDAGRKNLFARRAVTGEIETVAIDWGCAGIGAVGEDLASLVTQPIYWFNDVHPEQLWELDQIAFEAYVQGLRDVGWYGEPVLARLGYTLAVTLRAGLGIFIFEWTARDEAHRLWIESAIGHSMEEIADACRGLRTYVVACAEEARELIDSLGVHRSK